MRMPRNRPGWLYPDSHAVPTCQYVALQLVYPWWVWWVFKVHVRVCVLYVDVPAHAHKLAALVAAGEKQPRQAQQVFEGDPAQAAPQQQTKHRQTRWELCWQHICRA